jgi:hypothetical protein
MILMIKRAITLKNVKKFKNDRNVALSVETR